MGKRITAFLLSFALVTLSGCGGGGDAAVRPDNGGSVYVPPSGPTTTKEYIGFGLDHIDAYLAAIEGPVNYEPHAGQRQILDQWSYPPALYYGASINNSAYADIIVEYLRFVVGEVNDQMPSHLELQWGGVWTGGDAAGDIVIDVGDAGGALGWAEPVMDGTRLDDGIDITIDVDAIAYYSGYDDARFAEQLYNTVIHELIHAGGLWGHVPTGGEWACDLMDNGCTGERGGPEYHHWLALIHNADPTVLAGWDGSYEVLRGKTGAMGYEVWAINERVAWPWYGDSPLTSSGSRPTGNATYRGALVGWLPSSNQFVDGETTLVYDFAASDMDSTFTWDGGGGARYTAEVGELGTFYATDAMGTVHGAFYGTEHGYVSGSLDRADITASFGAQQQ